MSNPCTSLWKARNTATKSTYTTGNPQPAHSDDIAFLVYAFTFQPYEKQGKS